MSLLDRALVTILVALGNDALTREQLEERSRITPSARFDEALEISIERGYVEREGMRFYAAPRRPSQAESDKPTHPERARAPRSGIRAARHTKGGSR